jgi:hypothetical protein
MRHHSGHDEYPVRSKSEFLQHLDAADDALAVQKLQVEALIHLADALERLIPAIPVDADGGLMVALSNPAYGTLKVEVQQGEPAR